MWKILNEHAYLRKNFAQEGELYLSDWFLSIILPIRAGFKEFAYREDSHTDPVLKKRSPKSLLFMPLIRPFSGLKNAQLKNAVNFYSLCLEDKVQFTLNTVINNLSNY